MTSIEERDPRVAAALEVYARYQGELLAKGPLGGISDWIRSGRAPSSASLRAEGLTAEGPPETQEGAVKRHELRASRGAFTRAWGFSIPCAEAVEALGELDALTEIGAGTGYWTALLTAAGVSSLATDLNPEGPNFYGFEGGAHTNILGLDAATAIRKHPDRDVFCSCLARMKAGRSAQRAPCNREDGSP